MLKRMRRCANCGAEIESLRSTKTYCSDACRKKAARGATDLDQKAANQWMIEHLLEMGLISKLWPVYSWDESATIFALMTTNQNALDELNTLASVCGYNQVTEGEFTRAMSHWGIETTESGARTKAEIKAFYDARKDRRIAQGYTPSDKANDAH